MDATELKTVADRYDYFYMLIGRCITGWADVDEQLFLIFSQCVIPYEQASIIYYRSPGLDTRLNLVDEIICSVLPKTRSGAQPHRVLKSWKGCAKAMKDLLSTSRRIAHQPVKRIENLLLVFSYPELYGVLRCIYPQTLTKNFEQKRAI
jgi:hypothetical protein